MSNFVIDPAAAAAIWQQYVAPTLGKKIADMFARKTAAPTGWFVDKVIRPDLFDAEGARYYPVTDDVRTPGRNHKWAEAIALYPGHAEKLGADPLQVMTYFANQLAIASEPMQGDDGIELGNDQRPSDRVVLGDHHVFTFEFDVPDIAYLARQIGWVTPTKNPLDCPMGSFYTECSGYADFAGICAIWGGNKSLHIHVVFSTKLAAIAYGLETRSSSELRRGFMAHWGRLHSDFLRIVDAGGREADRALQRPEQYRRLPFGLRTVGKGHLLGIPEGTEVPQITLWEKSRERASGDKLPLFFSPDAFAPMPDIVTRHRAQTLLAPKQSLGTMTASQVAACSEKLAILYSGWPRFNHLTFETGRWVAKFMNSTHDRIPSSFMREDFQTIHLAGRDAQSIEGKPKQLPLPLGLMLRHWCEQAEDVGSSHDGEAPSETDLRVLRWEARFREKRNEQKCCLQRDAGRFSSTQSRPRR